MEKCLLDILEEECALVRDIDDLSKRIERTINRRIESLMSLVCEADYAYERHYIVHLQSEIDRMNAEKSKLQLELAEVRKQLKQYYKRYILD